MYSMDSEDKLIGDGNRYLFSIERGTTIMHEHHEGCACGHEHHHDDHTHHEHHDHTCGCECHDHNHHHEPEYLGGIEGLTDGEAQLLQMLGRYKYLPVARFLLRSGSEQELEMTAMAPVALNSADEEKAVVKARGEALQSLSDKGLITLDYDIPLRDYDYDGYTKSHIFAELEQMAVEAKGREGFLFDTAAMELGSMALTDAGEALLG